MGGDSFLPVRFEWQYMRTGGSEGIRCHFTILSIAGKERLAAGSGKVPLSKALEGAVDLSGSQPYEDSGSDRALPHADPIRLFHRPDLLNKRLFFQISSCVRNQGELHNQQDC